MLLCDKCGTPIPPGSKFCPQCADPVTEADLPASQVSTESAGVPILRIEFGYSSSSRYSDAVALAQKIPGYSQTGDGTSQVHAVELEATEVRLATSLWDMVSNWKQSRLTINGQRISKKDLTYGAFGCYQKRQEAFKPDSYCFGVEEYSQNIWGCHQLGLQLAAWRESWFTWGDFDGEGRWHWDKTRIRHELENTLHQYRFCPALNQPEVFRTLERLPDGVKPSTNQGWNLVKDWKDNREVPVGVAPTLATAVKLAARVGTPAWESNSSLDRATSTLQDYSRAYDIEIHPRISVTPPPVAAKTGCMVALAVIGALTSTTLVICSWLV